MAAQLAVTGHRPNEAPPRRSATEGGRRISSAAFFGRERGCGPPHLRPQQPPPPRCQRGERPALVNRTAQKNRSRYGSVQTEQSEEIIHTWIFCIDFQPIQIHLENFSQKNRPFSFTCIRAGNKTRQHAVTQTVRIGKEAERASLRTGNTR
mgnify:CR=1 FL=1